MGAGSNGEALDPFYRAPEGGEAALGRRPVAIVHL
jgi:hypothetical protein